MLISIVCLLVLILGFLTIISFKRNPFLRISAIVNKFFIILFVLSTIKFFINGITPFVEENNFKIVLTLVSTWLLVTSFPFCYMYIAELYIGYNISKSTIGHFLLPILILLGAVYYFFTFNYTFLISIRSAIVFIVFAAAIFYGVLIFRLIKKNKFRLESDEAIIQQHNKIIKVWSYFLFSFYCISSNIKSSVFYSNI